MPFFKKPNVFFGSATESLTIVDALIEHLNHHVECKPWTDAFPLAENTIDSLTKKLRECDFGVFVLSDLDITRMRGKDLKTSRDNVLFEAGMAIGKYGKLGCFLVTPRNIPDFHLPTDLLGIKTANYDSTLIAVDILKAMSPSSESIRDAIDESKWNKLRLELSSYRDTHDPDKMGLKNKAFIEFTNREKYAIRIELKEAKLANLLIDPEDSTFGGRRYYDPFFIESKKGHEFYRNIHTLKSGETHRTWIPIDPSVTREDLGLILSKNDLGILPISLELLNDEELRFNKVIKF